MTAKQLNTRMLEALWWIVEGYEDGEGVRGPKIAHGIAEARAILATTQPKVA